MQTSESIKQISAALVAFHMEVGKITKDAKNPFFKSTYASLSGILDAISEPLNNNGLAIVQFPESENCLTTRIIHISGEWMESTYSMKPVKDTPQDRGSAITYQRRYAIGAVLSLNIDEDDDANTASGKNNTPGAPGANDTEDSRPWLNENTKEFNGAIKKLSEGTTTIDKITKAFRVNKAIRAKLEEAAKQAA